MRSVKHSFRSNKRAVMMVILGLFSAYEAASAVLYIEVWRFDSSYGISLRLLRFGLILAVFFIGFQLRSFMSPKSAHRILLCLITTSLLIGGHVAIEAIGFMELSVSYPELNNFEVPVMIGQIVLFVLAVIQAIGSFSIMRNSTPGLPGNG